MRLQPQEVAIGDHCRRPRADRPIVVGLDGSESSAAAAAFAAVEAVARGRRCTCCTRPGTPAVPVDLYGSMAVEPALRDVAEKLLDRMTGSGTGRRTWCDPQEAQWSGSKGGSLMTQILIDIDDELLAKAAEELGTTTTNDTVNAALGDVLRRGAVAREIEFAKSGDYTDLLDPGVMKNAWR
jgi:Arc/MetJ family transcription regulator